MKYLIFVALLVSSVSLQAEGIQSSSDLDQTWKEYYQTRDKADVEKILTVINADTTTTFCAYEYLNRLANAAMLSKMSGDTKEPNLDDLEASIAAYEKKSPGFADRVHLATAAMWSMNQGLKKDAQLRADFESVIQEKPSLNYPKKIKLMLQK